VDVYVLHGALCGTYLDVPTPYIVFCFFLGAIRTNFKSSVEDLIIP